MSWRLIFLGCTVASLLFAWQVWLDYAYAGMPVSRSLALAISAANWFLWAPLVRLVEWLGRRFAMERGRWARSLLVHAPVSVFLAAIKTAVDQDVAATILGVQRVPSTLLQLYVTLLTYWAILGIAVALQQARDRRERDIRAAELETELARARLDALKVRLHPHFLFNTLNSISGLMREDVEAADLMITRLSDLLRLTLDRAEVQEVPLKEELDFVRLYLAIQQARFGSRLSVAVDVETACLGVMVPSLLLQPIVENAFKHGVGNEPGPVQVALRASRADGRLVIDVKDDGPGPPKEVQGGVGLTATRGRLERLYGPTAGVSLDPAPAGGTIARVTLPAREDQQ